MNRDIKDIRKSNLWDSIWCNDKYLGRLKERGETFFILKYRIHEYYFSIINNKIKQQP